MAHPVKKVDHPVTKMVFHPSQIRNSVEENTSPDGNVTVSTLSLMPTTMEAGNLLVCQAGNPRIPDSTLEDAWKLQIHCKETTLFFYYLIFLVHFPASKGQLISKCLFGALVRPKNQRNFLRVSALASKKRPIQKNKLALIISYNSTFLSPLVK